MAMGLLGGRPTHLLRVPLLVVSLIFLQCLCHVDAAGRFAFPGGGGGMGMVEEASAASVTVELTEATFNSTLRSAQASYALVEFFASWCPACRRFKPQYDRVAKLFNKPSAAYPDQILVAAVDCAKEANLCKRFSISAYPTMYFGQSLALAEGVGPVDAKEQPKGFERVDPPTRTSEGIVEWINGKISRTFQMMDATSSSAAGGVRPLSQRYMQRIADVYDMEEAVAMAFDLIFNTMVLDKDSRQALSLFSSLVATHHPSRRCRKGAAELLWRMDEIWPLVHEEVQLSPAVTDDSRKTGEPDLEELKKMKICGKDRPRGSWRSCQGSQPNSRGFSCGIWSTFHSLAARLDDNEGEDWLQGMCAYIGHFFICQQCRVHFLKHSKNAQVKTRREAVLWLWKTHNIVNKRLASEDLRTQSGDPEYPKMNWPPKELCPTCRAVPLPGTEGDWDVTWLEDEVYKFLMKFYSHPLGEDDIVAEGKRDEIQKQGGGQGTVGEEDRIIDVKQNNWEKTFLGGGQQGQAQMDTSTAVPAGAAIAVAIASCAFGIVACWWRVQQKKRKYVLGHA